MAENMDFDLFATDQTKNEAISALRLLLASFGKKQKKDLSRIKEVEDFSLRCERVRKFFAVNIGEQIMQLTMDGATFSFRYASGGLCCIASEWSEWLTYSEVTGVLDTAELSSSKKSKSAEAAPASSEVPVAPEFDFDDFFSSWDDWDDGFTSPSTPSSEPVTASEDKVVVSETAKPHVGNFYTDADALYIPTTKAEKIDSNIEAIRCLLAIEHGERELTREAQEIMARYTGWGGAAILFEETLEETFEQREALKSLLTPAEYESAKASTLTSFYTEPWMISLIYKQLMKFGFKGGTVLEPSMGVGNFFRFMPEEIRNNSRLYGVELDSITGRIATMLYPDAKIVIGGFETADYQCPDSFYDVVVGNVPFGNFKVWSMRFGNRFSVHDFFFANGLEKCRPGGVMCFITSRYSLDKKDSELRKWMAAHGTFLGAIRLPSKAFVGYGGADVTTDIVFFKREASDKVSQAFVDTVPLVNPEDGTICEDVVINEYFVAHEEQILGTMCLERGRFGDKLSSFCKFEGTRDELFALADKAAANIECVYEESAISIAEEGESVKRIEYDPTMNIQNYTFAFIEGDVYYREDNFLYLRKLSATAEKRVLHCCRVRDVLRNLLTMQAEGCSDEQFEAGARELNRVYDAAVSKIGFLSSRANALAFRDDADYPLLCSLENIDPNDEDNVTKSEIFTKRSIQPNLVLKAVDTAEDAIRCSLAQCGKLNPSVLRSVYNPYGDDVVGSAYMDRLAAEVPDMLFRDPDNNGFWTLSDEYLSGNVRMKLLSAKAAAKNEPDVYERNIKALQDIVPLELPLSDISFSIGTPWITCEDYTEFIRDVLFASYPYGKREIEVVYNKILNAYDVAGKNAARWCRDCKQFGYGTTNMNAIDIFIDLLNGRPIVVKVKNWQTGEYEPNPEETLLARQKAEELNEAFKDWIMKDADRVRRYEEYYNLYYNGTVLRHYDGSTLTFPGMNPSIVLRPYQRNAIARILFGKNTLVAHAVGAGKTYTLCSACYQNHRLGIWKKPLIIVPKSLLLQTASEFLRLYPNANILVASDRDFEKSRRKRFVARIATSSDFDACIMTHDQFAKIPVSKELREARIQSELENLTACMEELQTQEHSKRYLWTKRLETAKKRLLAKLQALQDKDEDDFLSFELLGLDAVVVDESHFFKNLEFPTCLNVAGVSGAASKRAEDLKVKTEFLNAKSDYRAVVFSTGTPIANTISEMYVVTSFLRDDLLKARGIESFDRWVGNFGEVTSEIELSVANKWQLKDRLARFKNLPELTSLFHVLADVVVSEDLPIERPKMRSGGNIIVECQMDEFAERVNATFMERAELIHSGRVHPSEDNFLKIATDARKLACDNRLVSFFDEETGEEVTGPYNENGKIAHLIENVFLEYHRFDSINFPATQVVFCDMGTPDGNQFNLYADIKQRLIERGIPAEEIRFVHEAKTDQQKQMLFKSVDAGKVRVLIGSSQKCGIGANFCRYLAAAHLLTCPWKPAEVEQMVGRIIRFGNRTPGNEVSVYQYVQSGGFDGFNWQTVFRKSQFIQSIMLNRNLDRTADDVDETTYSYGLLKLIATGDSSVKERMEAEVEVQRLKLLRSHWERKKKELLQDYQVDLPKRCSELRSLISRLEADLVSAEPLTSVSEVQETQGDDALVASEPADPVENWTLVLDSEESYHGFKAIADYLAKRRDELPLKEFFGEFFGQLGDFKLLVNQEFSVSGSFSPKLVISGELNYETELFVRRGDAIVKRIKDRLFEIPKMLERYKAELAQKEEDIITAKAQYEEPFEYEDALTKAKARLNELTALIMGGNG